MLLLLPCHVRTSIYNMPGIAFDHLREDEPGHVKQTFFSHFAARSPGLFPEIFPEGSGILSVDANLPYISLGYSGLYSCDSMKVCRSLGLSTPASPRAKMTSATHRAVLISVFRISLCGG